MCSPPVRLGPQRETDQKEGQNMGQVNVNPGGADGSNTTAIILVVVVLIVLVLLVLWLTGVFNGPRAASELLQTFTA
jgi:uncharacterized protein HemY